MAEGDGQGIGRQIRGVDLPPRGPKLLGDRGRVDECRLHQRRALGQGDGCAGRGGGRTAAAGLKADRGHAPAVEGEPDADQVAAGGAARDARWAPSGISPRRCG